MKVIDDSEFLGEIKDISMENGVLESDEQVDYRRFIPLLMAASTMATMLGDVVGAAKIENNENKNGGNKKWNM